MKVFDKYSIYYDLLYSDKNYDVEARYITELIEQYAAGAQKILDVGCGTGKHASILSQMGYNVEGLDASADMLKDAQSNFPNLRFYHEDARDFNVDKCYDVVTSLFHVASYQCTNQDVESYMMSIRKHLAVGGIFIFDFWYGPAVLTQKPSVRVKRMKNDKVSITRIAEPVMHINDNIVDVKYDILIEGASLKKSERISEVHRMRYFSMPEIDIFLRSCGFELISRFEWMTNECPDTDSWCVCVVAKAVSRLSM